MTLYTPPLPPYSASFYRCLIHSFSTSIPHMLTRDRIPVHSLPGRCHASINELLLQTKLIQKPATDADSQETLIDRHEITLSYLIDPRYTFSRRSREKGFQEV
jgi:hypothetical protein